MLKIINAEVSNYSTISMKIMQRLCGVCDVCIANKKLTKNDGLTDEIIKAVLNELSKNPLHLDQLIEAITSGNVDERLKVVRILLDAGKINVNGEFYYLKG
jgi:ATP-dependent DNA helicase RecQ